jgi:sugar/nucleoside kinase (ribokinase family)
MEKIALVGFSANAEIIPTYDRMTSREKGTLKSIVSDLCGTSANVARAIKQLGQSSKVLALTGINDDLESHILRFALEKFPVPFSEFRILNHSHISILPIDGIPHPKIFGKKGNIENGKINETIMKINEENGLWRIATGVRPEETDLVKELFNKHAGYRSLNPRLELITEREKFLNILKNTDLLIMNHSEFDFCEETSIELLHKYGPKLVIVTRNEEGGMFSKKGIKPEKFKPCNEYISSSEIYETGAGDWFHAAFIVRCIELNKSIDTLTIEEVRDCISFAAQVSGKKVTMPGAANGPSKKDLLTFN